MLFTATRNLGDDANVPITVNFTVGGTATFPTDYTVTGATTFTATMGSLIIPIGQMSATMTMTSVADLLFESDEAIVLTPQAQSGVWSIGNGLPWQGTILNDDMYAAPPSILLLHFNGANGSTIIVDSASPANTVTAVGGVQISTADSVFGGASLLLNGSGYVSVADVLALKFAANDFTIEFFCKLSTANHILGKGDQATAAGSAVSWSLGLGICQVYCDVGTYTLPTPAPPAGVFTHIAVTRQSGTLRYFVGGDLISSVAISPAASVNNVAQPLLIGAYGSASAGYIDEFRIVGTCEYTANFTPPTIPYAN